jgi:hypothetical protein
MVLGKGLTVGAWKALEGHGHARPEILAIGSVLRHGPRSQHLALPPAARVLGGAQVAGLAHGHVAQRGRQGAHPYKFLGVSEEHQEGLLGRIFGILPVPQYLITGFLNHGLITPDELLEESSLAAGHEIRHPRAFRFLVRRIRAQRIRFP